MRVVKTLTALVVGLLGMAAMGAAGPGAIYGNVKDSAGQPIAGALVTALSPASTDAGHIKTEGDGYYLLAELPAGRYEVRVEKEGYASETKEGVVVKEGGHSALVVVLSKPLPPPAPAKAAPVTQTAAQPSASMSTSAASSDAAPAPPPVPRGGYKARRRSIVGTIVALDSRAMIVDVGMGREVTVAYNGSTEIEGVLAIGKKVRVNAAVDVSSYRLAKSIKVSD